MKVLIVEPQCHGKEHARFNAGLLMASRKGYPEDELVFLAEEDHFANVSESLGFSVQSLDIAYIAIDIPERTLVNIDRLPQEVRLLMKILAICWRQGPIAIIFCSMTKEFYFLLKFAHFLALAPPSLSIFHSNLRALDFPPVPKHRLGRLYCLHRLLTKKNRKNRNIILGQRALAGLRKAHPIIAEGFGAIEMPYLWARKTREQVLRHPVVFGFFGVADSAKGFPVFQALAERFSKQIRKGLAKFVLVGWVRERDLEKYSSPWVEGIGADRISEQEFDRRSLTLNYSIWAVDFESYRQVASASLLDSVSYLTPILYPDSSATEDLKDLGYGYVDFEDLVQTVERLIVQFDQSKYEDQIEACKNWRVRHSPEQVGQELKRHLEPALSHKYLSLSV